MAASWSLWAAQAWIPACLRSRGACQALGWHGSMPHAAAVGQSSCCSTTTARLRPDLVQGVWHQCNLLGARPQQVSSACPLSWFGPEQSSNDRASLNPLLVTVMHTRHTALSLTRPALPFVCCSDFCSSLDGVRLCYGRKSGYGSYGPAGGLQRGVRMIELRMGEDASRRCGNGQAGMPCHAMPCHQWWLVTVVAQQLAAPSCPAGSLHGRSIQASWCPPHPPAPPLGEPLTAPPWLPCAAAPPGSGRRMARARRRCLPRRPASRSRRALWLRAPATKRWAPGCASTFAAAAMPPWRWPPFAPQWHLRVSLWRRQ